MENFDVTILSPVIISELGVGSCVVSLDHVSYLAQMYMPLRGERLYFDANSFQTVHYMSEERLIYDEPSGEDRLIEVSDF